MTQGRVQFGNDRSFVFDYTDTNLGEKIDETALQAAAVREVKARGLEGQADQKTTFVTASKQTFPWQTPVSLVRPYGDFPIARLFGNAAGAAVSGSLTATPVAQPSAEAPVAASAPASGGRIEDLPDAEPAKPQPSKTVDIESLPNA